MTTRTVLRPVAASAFSVLVMLALSPVSPAFANNLRDDGEMSGPGLTVYETLFIYVVIPAAIFGLITLLVFAPSWAKGPRYRPGVGWWAAPVWFNGPDDADAAIHAAVPTSAKEGGGASARW